MPRLGQTLLQSPAQYRLRLRLLQRLYQQDDESCFEFPDEPSSNCLPELRTHQRFHRLLALPCWCRLQTLQDGQGLLGVRVIGLQVESST